MGDEDAPPGVPSSTVSEALFGSCDRKLNEPQPENKQTRSELVLIHAVEGDDSRAALPRSMYDGSEDFPNTPPSPSSLSSPSLSSLLSLSSQSDGMDSIVDSKEHRLLLSVPKTWFKGLQRLVWPFGMQ